MAGDDLNLMIPQALKAALPLVRISLGQLIKTRLPKARPTNQHISQDSKTLATISRSRQAVANIISSTNTDDRLLVVVGPCSIHDTDAAYEYAQRLAALSSRLEHDLLVVMRVYVEKPRTTVGWKGLVHDPDMAQLGPQAESCGSIARGLSASRNIMGRVASLGLPVATELLSPLVVPFVDDLLALGVIGARTTESQTHRELSSEVPFPVGFKNGTDGSLGVALDAMRAAAAPHTLLGIDGRGALVERRTPGNPDTFVVLRGGKAGPNFAAEHVRRAEDAITGIGRRPAVVVDCSHGNSNKDYRNQAKVAACVGEQIADGSNISGVMIESNIRAGEFLLQYFLLALLALAVANGV